MVRSVALDMRDRAVDAVDHLRGDDRIEIFRRPILLGRRLCARVGVAHASSPRTSQPASISMPTSGLR
jgi:hypothetical protein